MDLEKKFHSIFKWNTIGSIFFEAMHIGYQFLLLKILGYSVYGLMGSVFSILYLTIYLSDLGLMTSLPTFANVFTQSKSNFKKYFRQYVTPNIFFLIIGIFISLFFYGSFFSANKSLLPPLYLVISLLIFESVRMFLRFFLHTQFKNKAVIVLELSLMVLYVTSVLLPYYISGVPITITKVIGLYLVNSIVSVACFIFITIRLYKKLPEKELVPYEHFKRKSTHARFFNHATHIGKHLISGEFLVPLFAIHFGLKQAGLLKLASIVAHSIKAFFKAAINFSGNAFLSNLKNKPLESRISAFYTLFKKLNVIIYFIFIVLLINFHPLVSQARTPGNRSAFIYLFMFITITLIQQLCVAYEQFYIVENAAHRLFFIKAFEFIMFYIVVGLSKHLYPNTTLLSIVCIQIISFALLALNAYAKWKIKPNLKINPKFILKTVLFGTLVFLLIKSL